jgi:hypothetical protein
VNTEIPNFLPPLPPVPDGFSRWEYRGEGWRCDDGQATTYASAVSAESSAKTGYPHKWTIREDRWPEGMGFYIEAVKDPNNLEGPPPTAEERAAMARELDRIAPKPADKFALMFGQRPTPHDEMRKCRHECQKCGGFWVAPERLEDALRQLAEVRDQRDRLAETLRDIRDRAQDETIRLHPDADAKGCVDDCMEWAESALASLET